MADHLCDRAVFRSRVVELGEVGMNWMAWTGLAIASTAFGVGMVLRIRKELRELEALRQRIARDEPEVTAHLRWRAACRKACAGIATEDLERPGINDAFQRAAADGDHICKACQAEVKRGEP